MSRISRITDAGLDAEQADPALLHQVRLLNVTTVAMVAFALPILAFAFAIDVVPMQITLSFVMIAAIANLALLRRTLRTKLCGHVACGLMLIVALSAGLQGGGIHQPNFSWIYLLPIASAVLVGTPGFWTWIGASLAAVVGFWTLAELGVVFPNVIPPEMQSLQNGVTRVAAVSAVAILSSCFITVQRRLEADLAQRARLQQRATESLQLLHDATIAATESETVEDVFRRVLDLVRVRGHYTIGHVLARCDQDPDSLASTGIWSFDPAPALEEFAWRARNRKIPSGEGILGRALASGTVVQSHDLDPGDGAASRVPIDDDMLRAELRLGIAIPIRAGGQVDAVMALYREDGPAPSDREIDLLCDVAARVAPVIERRRADEQIQSLAFYDVLTGLPNRQRFHERLAQTLARADGTVALLFVDLDDFKNVNDSLGHAAGDQLLFAVADRFMRCVRDTDSVSRPGVDTNGAVARLGGDEFTVLLTEVDGVAGAELVATRLLGCLADPVRIDGQDVFVTASIGIALYPDDAPDADSLIRNADGAMYLAKSSGRNNYQFYTDSLSERGARRGLVASRLYRALERGDLRLAFQPIRSLATGEISAVEALLRWSDSVLGHVSPEEFVRVAEESGLIVPIGEWVFETACRYQRSWADRGFEPVRIALNISGRQIRHPEAVDRFAEIIESTGCSTAWLEIELTESTIMQDDEATNTALARLHELGIGLSLDDFGTGYSSLSYLKRFPLDRVKIDRSFVSELPENADDIAITTAIVAMAHSLRLAVVAEGVESEAQLAFLREIGCDEVQGYLLSPPVAANGFERFLKRTKPTDG